MQPQLCGACGARRAALRRPRDGSRLCRECFSDAFESEVHRTITHNALFARGERVAIAASGGKDSTVLAHVLTRLNKRHDYGVDLVLLSIDEGIAGYRDDSLEAVKRNQQQFDIPLLIVSYRELYGWTMDEIVKKIGTVSNCTFCGVFRRQALDRGAMRLRVDKIATGHNADDIAETVVMNMLRGDPVRLQRCTRVVTGGEGPIARCKPFKYAYEKEIVMYAFFHKLDYFSTECLYAPHAYRGHAREYIKQLEALRPSAILDIIFSAENVVVDVPPGKRPVLTQCSICGYMSSNAVCKACVMLEALRRDNPIGMLRRGGASAVHQAAAAAAASASAREAASVASGDADEGTDMAHAGAVGGVAGEGPSARAAVRPQLRVARRKKVTVQLELDDDMLAAQERARAVRDASVEL